MSTTRSSEPSPVRIETANEAAWCGERRLDLTPRAFAVLRYLVEHPQRLVTKDDLLATVWRDAIVSDAALASCIRDLRKALGDSSEAPRYIETVHRRGFRFIGPIAPVAPGLSAQPSTLPEAGVEVRRPPELSSTAPTVVGRRHRGVRHGRPRRGEIAPGGAGERVCGEFHGSARHVSYSPAASPG